MVSKMQLHEYSSCLSGTSCLTKLSHAFTPCMHWGETTSFIKKEMLAIHSGILFIKFSKGAAFSQAARQTDGSACTEMPLPQCPQMRCHRTHATFQEFSIMSAWFDPFPGAFPNPFTLPKHAAQEGSIRANPTWPQIKDRLSLHLPAGST